MIKVGHMRSLLATALVAIVPAAGQADDVFVSPRHSQVTMKGNWYPELHRIGEKWYVLFFYVLNFTMVAADVALYARNKRLDKLAGR